MNFFKRDKTEVVRKPSEGLAPIYSSSASLTGKEETTPEKTIVPQAPSITSKQTIDTLASELKDSAEKQLQASKRLLSLNKDITKMEAGLRHVERLEKENKALGSDLQSMRKKLEQKTDWATDQESKLSSLEKQHTQLRQQLELAKADIAQRKDREVDDHEKLIKQSREIEALTIQVNQKEERLASLLLSNQKLQDEVAQQGAMLSSQNHRVMELQKSTEETAARLDAKSKLADTSSAELKNMRIDFNEMKSKYFEATGALENAKYDIKTQKNVYEDTLKRRDDEGLALKSRIEQLNTQLRIKDNMSTHFDEEVTALRTQLETERERNDRNEARFRAKADEVESNARALARGKVEFENLNAKFAAAMEDIDTLRKINLVQKQKLERYAAIGGVSAGQTLLSTSERPRSSRVDELADLNKDDTPRLKAVK